MELGTAAYNHFAHFVAIRSYRSITQNALKPALQKTITSSIAIPDIRTSANEKGPRFAPGAFIISTSPDQRPVDTSIVLPSSSVT